MRGNRQQRKAGLEGNRPDARKGPESQSRTSTAMRIRILRMRQKDNGKKKKPEMQIGYAEKGGRWRRRVLVALYWAVQGPDGSELMRGIDNR